MSLVKELNGKRILFLSVQTFNYEKIISDELRSVGAIVDYFDERPSNSTFAKGMIRLKRSLYQKRIDNYYKGILKKIKETQYQYLFVIRGEVVPAFFLKELKENQPTCLFLFYTWDSFANHTHPISIQQYFDKSFTFDSEDAKKYDLYFRPLFYLNEYSEIRNYNKDDIKYNLLFLGTAHSDRYHIGNRISRWCASNNLTSYSYYYMHGRLVYLYKKAFDDTFKKFRFREISFRSLKVAEIVKLYRKSQAILDINHPGQTGLTMRTFEALGSGKKLITTNERIKEFPFYNPNNILVIDRNDARLNLEFFRTDFIPIENRLLQEMSLKGWLLSIFVASKPNFWLEGYK